MTRTFRGSWFGGRVLLNEKLCALAHSCSGYDAAAGPEGLQHVHVMWRPIWRHAQAAQLHSREPRQAPDAYLSDALPQACASSVHVAHAPGTRGPPCATGKRSAQLRPTASVLSWVESFAEHRVARKACALAESKSHAIHVIKAPAFEPSMAALAQTEPVP